MIIGAAILGLLVGLPSRRLIGDYLAIVTLFFGEAFVEFTNNVAPHTLGGPNGIVGIDPIHGRSAIQLTTNKGYYYLLLVLLVLTMARAAPARHARAPGGPGARSATTRSPPRR